MWLFWNVEKFASFGDAIECCYEVAKEGVNVSFNFDGYNIIWQTWHNGIPIGDTTVDMSYIQCVLTSTDGVYIEWGTNIPIDDDWIRVKYTDVPIGSVFWDVEEQRHNFPMKKVDNSIGEMIGPLKPRQFHISNEYVWINSFI